MCLHDCMRSNLMGRRHHVIACECDGHQVIVGTSLANSGFAIIFGALHVSLWMGFVLITAGELKFGHLTAFQGYQMQIVMGIGQVAGAAMQLASAMGGASKIFELLDRTPEIPTRGGEVPESTMRGALFFEDLKFAFPTAVDRPVRRPDDL
jgi:ABC-type multidrug transport system fused ATPase/permease subunit